MTLPLILGALGLLAGFVVGRQLYQARLDRSRRPSVADEEGETRRSFDGLSNDQQWLVARLVDEGSLPAADWNSCLDAVVFVERDAATDKRRIKREFQDALTRIIKGRQPDIRKSPPNGGFGKSSDVLR